jgi:ribosomal protein S16
LGCTGLTSVYFEGNAPKLCGDYTFYGTAKDFKIIYRSTATGFSCPTWKGYPTQVITSKNKTARKSRAFRSDGTYTPLANRLAHNLREDIDALATAYWADEGKNITREEFRTIFVKSILLAQIENPHIRL